jgi:hypothetical protein
MAYGPVQAVGYQNGYYGYPAANYANPYAGQMPGYGYVPAPVSGVPGYWYGR